MEEPKEPAGFDSCSPASLPPRLNCRIPGSVPESVLNNVKSPIPFKEDDERSASNPAARSSCSGAECPATGAEADEAAMEARSPPQQRPLLTRDVMYGPMTQESYERMVVRKRAALRERLMREGRLSKELDAFLKEAPSRLDANGIPMPAPSATGPRDAPRNALADFEMRFKPQSPAPAPTETVEAASAPRRPSDDFEMVYEPAAPSPAPQPRGDRTAEPTTERVAASPEGAASWHARERLRADTAAALQDSARRLQQRQGGPGRPPMTEAEEAAKLGPQEAANLAARKRAAAAAAAARRRAATGAGVTGQELRKPLLVRAPGAATAAAAKSSSSSSGPADLDWGSMPASSQPADGMPEVPRELLERSVGAKLKAAGAKEPAGVPLLGAPDDTGAFNPDVTAQHRRRTDIERVLMVDAEAEAGAAGKAKAKAKAAAEAEVTAVQARRRAAALDEIRRQRAKAEAERAAAAAAAAGSWALLDYVCLFALLAVIPVAVLMAAAILEEIFVPAPVSPSLCGRPRRQAGTPLPLHWLALTHALWRRSRRAFAAARKHLTGHASDLPTSANEGSGALARAVAAASGFVHVFLAHLCDLRHGSAAPPACSPAAAAAARAARASGDGARSPLASCGGAAAAPANPFSGLPASTGGAGSGGEALVLTADDAATATAMAELQLRRRH
ncbi:hypothetical protein GPECTOR_6g808 [Gonium pectorale]|uniref:Uncharacterized protein n=1 Tax=Gonium pectorale TaxID=33097 RepID=A0A150GWY9_GONPE|nr:hypothetical protein GPECTOR_6g808 [Gonium pectorale]|eukprot:KXZ53890.1 hypothetical protein GPECTOR_6g808 [Gonium pectorale]